MGMRRWPAEPCQGSEERLRRTLGDVPPSCPALRSPASSLARPSDCGESHPAQQPCNFANVPPVLITGAPNGTGALMTTEVSSPELHGPPGKPTGTSHGDGWADHIDLVSSVSSNQTKKAFKYFPVPNTSPMPPPPTAREIFFQVFCFLPFLQGKKQQKKKKRGRNSNTP